MAQLQVGVKPIDWRVRAKAYLRAHRILALVAITLVSVIGLYLAPVHGIGRLLLYLGDAVVFGIFLNLL